MTGSEIIALAGVLSTLGAAVFTQWWQRKGERERFAEQRDERLAERWLDYRREMYGRFLKGADDCYRAVGLRLRDLQYVGTPPAEGDGEGYQPDIRETSADEGLATCAEALEGMRLVAPRRVVDPAAAFLRNARELEWFSALASTNSAPPGESLSAEFDRYVREMSDSARDAFAAMREDVGAEPTEFYGLGSIDPFVQGC